MDEQRRRGANLFQMEREGDTLVVIPLVDLSELAFQEIEAGGRGLLELLDHTSVKNVIMDFYMTDYYGSSALGFFVKLWKRVSRCNGRMAFCNVSDYEKEILQTMRLDQLWPIYLSRAAVRN